MDEEAVKALLAALTPISPVKAGNGAFGYIVPQGYRLEEMTNTTPEKIEGEAHFTTMDSFMAYLEKFRDDHSAVFVGSNSAMAVLDYHSDKAPGACLHRALLHFMMSKEWNSWLARDGEKTSQMAFAEFVDQFADDFREPDGATMLELATTLKAHGSISFSSRASLTSSGVNFSYTEEVDGSAGKRGELVVPEKFTIAIPVFDRGPRFAINARLLWSVKDGDLRIGYRLYRPDLVQQAAQDEVFEMIEGVGINTYHGSL